MANSNTYSIAKKIKNYFRNNSIIEKKLGIPPDYQAKALKSKNFLQSNWHRNKLLILEKVISKGKDKILLDLGTGSGNLELHFHDKVGKIIGVDYNDEALLYLQSTLTKEKIRNIDLIQADIRKLKKVNTIPKADYITMIDVIEHLYEKDVRKLVRELSNYLKKGGKVIIITPNYHSIWPFIERFLERLNLVPRFTNAQHLSKMDRRFLNKLFSKNGFRCNNFTTFNTISFLAPSRKISGFLCSMEYLLKFPYGNLILAVYSNSKSN